MVGLGVSFDEFAFAQCRTGADERDEVGCVNGPPPVLGGFDVMRPGFGGEFDSTERWD